jgi:hypothetical protein
MVQPTRSTGSRNNQNNPSRITNPPSQQNTNKQQNGIKTTTIYPDGRRITTVTPTQNNTSTPVVNNPMEGIP